MELAVSTADLILYISASAGLPSVELQQGMLMPVHTIQICWTFDRVVSTQRKQILVLLLLQLAFCAVGLPCHRSSEMAEQRPCTQQLAQLVLIQHSLISSN